MDAAKTLLSDPLPFIGSTGEEGPHVSFCDGAVVVFGIIKGLLN